MPLLNFRVPEPVPVVYAIEAEPVAEEGAEEAIDAQDSANPELAQDKPPCIPP
uniref:Uncharacterized protein n=1 Tax=Arundo donax TaxID=35708 RepID=A0A0A9FPC6_ARUDO